MYQQGNFSLTTGQTDYSVNFSTVFPVAAPSLILVDVFNSAGEDPQDFLDGVVVSRTTAGFEFNLVTAPASNNYVLSWLASDGLGTTPVTSNGIPVSDFPVFNGSSLPENTLFPVVIPNGPYRSATVRWNKIKSLMAASHQHNVADISDSGSIGRALVQSTTQNAALSVIGAAAASHSHTASQISDATTIGRGVITAADASEIRLLIEVPDLVHSHTSGEITDATAVGLSVLTAANTSAAQTALNVPDIVHTHTTSQISDASAVGLSLMTSANEEAARTAIMAASSVGWENTESLTSSRSLSVDDFGNKFIVSNVLTYNIPAGVDNLGRVGFHVLVDANLTITKALAVTVIDSRGNTISDMSDLPKGFYVLEALGLNTFSLVGFSNAFQRSILNATDSAEFLTALNIEIDDIPGISNPALSLVTAATQAELNAVAGQQPLVLIDGSNFSSFWTGSPAGNMFYSESTDLTIDSLGSMSNGQSFTIKNTCAENMVISLGFPFTINGITNQIRLEPQESLVFTQLGLNNLSCNYPRTEQSDENFVAYVAPHGVAGGVLGDITKPFSAVSLALSELAPRSKRVIVVLPGEYDSNFISCVVNSATTVHIHFMPGAYVNLTSGSNLFELVQGSLFITGGRFYISDNGGRFAFVRTANAVEFNAEVDHIEVLSSVSGQPLFETFELTTDSPYRHILKADTIKCAPVLLAKADAGDCTIKVRNLTTGNSALLIDSSTVNLHINSGSYVCGNRILDPASVSYELNFYAENATVEQGLATYTTDDFIIRSVDANGTFRVNGSGCTINSIFASGIARADAGNLIISNTTLVGGVVLNGGNTILNSTFISIPDGSPQLSIDSLDPGNEVTIYGTCMTNKNYNTADVVYVGGSILYNTAFII